MARWTYFKKDNTVARVEGWVYTDGMAKEGLSEEPVFELRCIR